MAMEVHVTAKKMESDSKEFADINSILPTLLKEGLLTDIDCRMIASYSNLMQKKGAIYAVIMSKTKEEAAVLTEIFRKMTMAFHKAENPLKYKASNNEESNHLVLPSRNPFLINMIIKRLFGFLPLEDLKVSRLVNRQWNSTVEICLRKRTAIHFRHDVVLPHTFMEVSKYSLPDLPFPSFAFSNDDVNAGWPIADIQYFLEQWEKNIEEVTFNSLKLMDKEVFISSYDVAQLFVNPTNITSLNLYPLKGIPKTTLDITLEKFVSLKILSFSCCRVIVSAENQSTPIPIVPVSISFLNVCFIQNGEFLPHYHYNNLIDFSKALYINVDRYFVHPEGAILDMGKKVFNAKQMDLAGTSVENWAQAKGNVKILHLYDIPFVEKNNLKITALYFGQSKIDLTALPQTLEILQFAEDGINEIICSEPLNLPKLKYLRIDVKDKDSLAYFTNCANLIELEIRKLDPTSGPCTLNLGYVPRSVKRIIMELPQIEFVDNYILELGTLVMLCSIAPSGLTDCTANTAQIKAKVLAIVCDEESDIDSFDIVKLVVANKQSEKILIGSYSDLHKKTPFEGSELSKCVDEKSNNYLFENGVGKSIPEEEFNKYVFVETYFPNHFN